MQKIQKILICLMIILFVGFIIFEIPTIADWGDYDSYDSSSSYDDWGSSSSSDWGSSDSSWGSSWDDDDYYYGGSSSSGSSIVDGLVFWTIIKALGPWLVLFLIIYFVGKKRNGYSNYGPRKPLNNYNFDIARRRQQNRDVLFGASDTEIENSIQAIDPMFNKAEFLSYAGDMFVKLQYAWSDRNLEEIRYLITPELYEQTNSQVQRYITNKQINKIERVSVNLSRLYSFSQEGDRDILRVVLESKMNDYIIDENTGNVVKGNPSENIVNPYILTFVRKTGVTTQEGGTKPVTMNCPNCGGATTILSSGKCPYCGSIITTRDNNWTLSELKRYNPNA